MAEEKTIGGKTMEYCKLQFGCLVVILYIYLIYFRECKRYDKKLQKFVCVDCYEEEK